MFAGSGSTPLHYAACGGNQQCCQVCIYFPFEENYTFATESILLFLLVSILKFLFFCVIVWFSCWLPRVPIWLLRMQMGRYLHVSFTFEMWWLYLTAWHGIDILLPCLLVYKKLKANSINSFLGFWPEAQIYSWRSRSDYPCFWVLLWLFYGVVL